MTYDGCMDDNTAGVLALGMCLATIVVLITCPVWIGWIQDWMDRRR